MLAVGGYVAMAAVVRTEAQSIRILERSTLQRTLVGRAALMIQLLILTDEAAQRERLRDELTRVLGEIEELHAAMAHPPGGEAALSAAERAAYFQAPLRLETRIHGFLDAARSLATLPDSQLTFSHPDYLVIIATAAGGSSAVLDSVVQAFMTENERGIARLRASAFVALIVLLAGLVGVGLGIFAPLVRRMDEETALLEGANAALKRLSALDGLTGIPNRRSFEERIEEEWRRALRDRAQLSVLMVDIDHFKPFNDRYGHLRGDECLKRIARSLSTTVNRPGDFVARYGGEEFVAILPDTDDRGAALVAERARAAVERMGIEHEASTAAPVVTVSVGMATVKPEPQLLATDLIGAADQALYAAKGAGRNQVASESPPRQPARSL